MRNPSRATLKHRSYRYQFRVFRAMTAKVDPGPEPRTIEEIIFRDVMVGMTRLALTLDEMMADA